MRFTRTSALCKSRLCSKNSHQRVRSFARSALKVFKVALGMHIEIHAKQTSRCMAGIRKYVIHIFIRVCIQACDRSVHDTYKYACLNATRQYGPCHEPEIIRLPSRFKSNAPHIPFQSLLAVGIPRSLREACRWSAATAPRDSKHPWQPGNEVAQGLKTAGRKAKRG